MGTARWEKEAAEELNSLHNRAELERRKRELRSTEAEALARRQAAQDLADASRAGLELLKQEELAQQKRAGTRESDLRLRRRADQTDGSGQVSENDHE